MLRDKLLRKSERRFFSHWWLPRTFLCDHGKKFRCIYLRVLCALIFSYIILLLCVCVHTLHLALVLVNRLAGPNVSMWYEHPAAAACHMAFGIILRRFSSLAPVLSIFFLRILLARYCTCTRSVLSLIRFSLTLEMIHCFHFGDATGMRRYLNKIVSPQISTSIKLSSPFSSLLVLLSTLPMHSFMNVEFSRSVLDASEDQPIYRADPLTQSFCKPHFDFDDDAVNDYVHDGSDPAAVRSLPYANTISEAATVE